MIFTWFCSYQSWAQEEDDHKGEKEIQTVNLRLGIHYDFAKLFSSQDRIGLDFMPVKNHLFTVGTAITGLYYFFDRSHRDLYGNLLFTDYSNVAFGAYSTYRYLFESNVPVNFVGLGFNFIPFRQHEQEGNFNNHYNLSYRDVFLTLGGMETYGSGYFELIFAIGLRHENFDRNIEWAASPPLLNSQTRNLLYLDITIRIGWVVRNY